jgi:hypothetical protein
MRTLIFSISALFLTATGCINQHPDYHALVNNINNEISRGNLEKASSLADSVTNNSKDDILVWKADSLKSISRRINLDFTLSKDQITEQLQNRIEDFKVSDLEKWESNGWLEYRIINGEKKYFNRAASNLVRLRNFYLDRPGRDSSIARDKNIIFRKRNTEQIISASENMGTPVIPVSMTIIYTITLKPDAVPSGETVRCWLPFPKENDPRQKDVYLLGITNEDFLLAPDTSLQRSIYIENKAEEGKPLIFRISYSYESSGQYFDPEKLKILPYNRETDFYRKYTSEQLPQICFTEDVKHLADSIVGNEENPYRIVKKLYYWFNTTIPWASAQEYSIMGNIPEYVIKNRRGDCGMQTLLLMSMLRYKGIPVKWQSGWMMPPGNKNLHDWCEVWYEGTGWVPVDVSYGLQYSSDLKTREFYITGIDSYRLIINDGISGIFYPEKKFLRSEPYDFQRGEVEWDGGNLYFDKWDYDMQIEYNEPHALK